MTTTTIALWVTAAVLLFWAVGAYNRLVRLRHALSRRFAVLDQQCDARRALLQRLAERLAALPGSEATATIVQAALAQCDAEKLPFPDAHFDLVTVAFGLRNMTHKDAALAEMTRVLRPGGRLLVLEFSRVWQPLAPLYDTYSFQVLPRLGKLVADDADSYRYLAESIRMHPDQETLKGMMEAAGLQRVQYFNLTAGVVALHRGVRA